MRLGVTLLILFVCALNALGQSPQKNNKSNNLKIKSIFFLKDNNDSIFSLIGEQCMDSINVKLLDITLRSWQRHNRKVDLIPISSIKSSIHDSISKEIVFCLIVSKTDTLNCALVRNGILSAGCFEWFSNIDIISAHSESTEKYMVKHYMDKTKYEDFKKSIQLSEIYAKANNKGMWGKYKNNEIDND